MRRAHLPHHSHRPLAHLVPRIPVEIVLEILSHLDMDIQADRQTIATFALVNKGITYYCQKKLFEAFDLRRARIRLPSRGPGAGGPDTGLSALGAAGQPQQRGRQTYEEVLLHYIHRFARVLQRSPHLRSLVRSVYLHFDLPASNMARVLNSLTSTDLPLILSLLVNVKLLEVDIQDLSVRWDFLPRNFAFQIYHTMRKGNGVETLRLGGLIGVPIFLFNMSPRLRFLNLRNTRVLFCGPHEWADAALVSQFYGKPEFDNSRKRELTGLTVSGVGCEIAFAVDEKWSANLKAGIRRLFTFTVGMDMPQLGVQMAWRIIQSNAPTLKSLKFIHEDLETKPTLLAEGQVLSGDRKSLVSGYIIAPYMTLTNLTSLIDLEITVPFFSLVPDGTEDVYLPESLLEQPLIPWIYLLSTGSRTLRKLTLILDCFQLSDNEFVSTCFERETPHTIRTNTKLESSWKQLDRVLANQRVLPSLEEVHIIFKTPEDDLSTASSMWQAPDMHSCEQEGCTKKCGKYASALYTLEGVDEGMFNICHKEVDRALKYTDRRGVEISAEVLIE